MHLKSQLTSGQLAKLISVTFAFILLTGCATTAKLETKLNSLVGDSAESLIESWGYPDSTIEAPNGNTVYIYKQSQLYSTPNTGYIFSVNCDISFELSEQKEIIVWRWRGNGCKSR